MSLVDLMSMAKPNMESRKKILSKLKGKELANCFQCMKCTSGCTALKLLELKPNEIVKLVNLGFVDELPNSDIIWTTLDRECLNLPKIRLPKETFQAALMKAMEEK
jgi:heterodisulfide reductase subunit C